MFVAPKMIRSAISAGDKKMSAAMDGVLKSAHFTSFQHQAMKGIIDDAKVKKDKPMKMLSKVKAGKTKKTIGVVQYPGSKP